MNQKEKLIKEYDEIRARLDSVKEVTLGYKSEFHAAIIEQRKAEQKKDKYERLYDASIELSLSLLNDLEDIDDKIKSL